MERDKWNKVLDRYLGERVMEVEDYEEMNDTQKTIIQEIKKAFKRIINKYENI